MRILSHEFERIYVSNPNETNMNAWKNNERYWYILTYIWFILCVLAIDPQNELSEIWTVTPLISDIDGVAVLNSSKVLLVYLTEGH